MASILKVLESQNLKKCDKDLGGCDRPGTPFRKLNAVPDVFTLLMAWEENVPGKDIKETLDLVDVEVSAQGQGGGEGRLHSTLLTAPTSPSPPSVVRCCLYMMCPFPLPRSSTCVTCTTSPSPAPSACTPCSVTTASTTAPSSTTRR